MVQQRKLLVEYNIYYRFVPSFKFLIQKKKIDGDVLDDNIFKACINRSFEQPPIAVQNNKIFKTEFDNSLKNMFQHLLDHIGNSKETDQRYRFVGFCGLYLFYYNLFMDTTDKKFFKRGKKSIADDYKYFG